jgi:ComF family protein
VKTSARLTNTWHAALRLASTLTSGLPNLCAVCHSHSAPGLCSDCQMRFAAPRLRCVACAVAVRTSVSHCGVCIRQPPVFDAASAAVDYAYPWNGLLTRLKFHDGLDLLPALVPLMLAAHTPSPDALLLPVPVSPSRLRERGFNQAWELTRRLAQASQVRADPHLLVRVRDTPHQLGLTRKEREIAVRHAFAVDALRREEITGRSITVVDDVMTTMATANEITRVLKQAGAAHVRIWCLARTLL